MEFSLHPFCSSSDDLVRKDAYAQTQATQYTPTTPGSQTHTYLTPEFLERKMKTQWFTMAMH